MNDCEQGMLVGALVAVAATADSIGDALAKAVAVLLTALIMFVIGGMYRWFRCHRISVERRP